MSSRHVGNCGSIGRWVVLGIHLGRFDHPIKFIDSVDLARGGVVGAWLQGAGLGDVVQAKNGVRRMVRDESAAYE
jgi:hypothetical protein